MFGLFGKNRIDEDAVNDVIDFLNDNPSIKKRVLREIFDKEVVANALADVFTEEGTEIHCFLQDLSLNNMYQIEKEINKTIDSKIKAMDIDNKIKEKGEEFLKRNPEYKTLHNLDKEIKEIKSNLKKLLSVLSKADITTTIEKLKEATQK